MPQVSVTRLRLRSNWYLPLFVWNSARSLRQARRAEGCLAAVVRRQGGAFWTLTLWCDAAAARSFMLTGAHRNAMPKLKRWCDEASLAHWEQESLILPNWTDAERNLRDHGRASVVDNPSPAHAAGSTVGKVP